MKVIVDANIVFSGILNTKGKIGDLLINSTGLIDFIAPDFLRTEIRKHYKKLVELSKLSLEQVMEAEVQICRDITFVSEEQISPSNWKKAYELVKDIDPKDVQYVAFAMQLDRQVWSGDKVLIAGLAKMGVAIMVTTDEIYKLREVIRHDRMRRRK